MKNNLKISALAMLVTFLTLGTYYSTWRFYFHDRISGNPFVEESFPDFAARPLRFVFKPLEEYQYKQEQKESLERLCERVEGHWKFTGIVYHSEGAHEIIIKEGKISFINVPGWPHLDKETFAIKPYDKRFSVVSIDGRPFRLELITYFKSDQYYRLRIWEEIGMDRYRLMPTMERIEEPD